jgi:hypothetical protein
MTHLAVQWNMFNHHHACMHADHLKLMFPMAWTISTMAWTILDGHQLLQTQQFDGSSNLQWAIKSLEHGLSFLLECAYDNGEFVYQVRQLFGHFCCTRCG